MFGILCCFYCSWNWFVCKLWNCVSVVLLLCVVLLVKCSVWCFGRLWSVSCGRLLSWLSLRLICVIWVCLNWSMCWVGIWCGGCLMCICVIWCLLSVWLCLKLVCGCVCILVRSWCCCVCIIIVWWWSIWCMVVWLVGIVIFVIGCLSVWIWCWCGLCLGLKLMRMVCCGLCWVCIWLNLGWKCLMMWNFFVVMCWRIVGWLKWLFVCCCRWVMLCFFIVICCIWWGRIVLIRWSFCLCICIMV